MILKGTRARGYLVLMSRDSAHHFLTHHLAVTLLVNHALRCIREVTKLRLPHNEGARIFEGVPAIEEDPVEVTQFSRLRWVVEIAPELEAQNGEFGKGGIHCCECCLVFSIGAQRQKGIETQNSDAVRTCVGSICVSGEYLRGQSTCIAERDVNENGVVFRLGFCFEWIKDAFMRRASRHLIVNDSVAVREGAALNILKRHEFMPCRRAATH